MEKKPVTTVFIANIPKRYDSSSLEEEINRFISNKYYNRPMRPFSPVQNTRIIQKKFNDTKKSKSRQYGFCEASDPTLAFLCHKDNEFYLEDQKLRFERALQNRQQDLVRSQRSVLITEMPKGLKSETLICYLDRRGLCVEWSKWKGTKTDSFSLCLRFETTTQAKRFINFENMFFKGDNYQIQVLDNRHDQSSARSKAHYGTNIQAYSYKIIFHKIFHKGIETSSIQPYYNQYKFEQQILKSFQIREGNSYSGKGMRFHPSIKRMGECINPVNDSKNGLPPACCSLCEVTAASYSLDESESNYRLDKGDKYQEIRSYPGPRQGQNPRGKYKGGIDDLLPLDSDIFSILMY